MRFSGHESFACRYTWLPKAYRALEEDPAALADEERAMVKLGVGKNMVRSIRFWVDVMGVASPYVGRQFELTPFGRAIFADDGYDPFLEDVRTLWLLHWRVSTYAHDPVFAWHFLISRWPYAELTRTEALLAFKRESDLRGGGRSDVTLSQHLDVFLHTYLRSRTETCAEDSLDGPLVELRLLQYVGDRRVGGVGRREPVYAFRREPKPEISSQLFVYCLHEYWHQRHVGEATLTFRDVALAPCSLGQVFKLTEDDIRARLDAYALSDGNAPFVYQPSAVQGFIARRHGSVLKPADLLRSVYETTPTEARCA